MLSKAAWKWVACCWYFSYFASEVCIGPFINVYLQEKGLSEQQIGLISAFKPWIAVAASFLWSLAADYFQAHRLLMVVLLVGSGVARIPLPWTSSFAAFFIFIIVNCSLSSPVNIVADAAVTGRCTEDGEYGRYRLYGALGWGGMSTLAGLASDAYGIRASLLLSLLLMVPCAVLSWFLWDPPAPPPQQQHDARKKAQPPRVNHASKGKAKAKPSKVRCSDNTGEDLEMSSLIAPSSPRQGARAEGRRSESLDGFDTGDRHLQHQLGLDGAAERHGAPTWAGGTILESPDGFDGGSGQLQQQQQHAGLEAAEPSFLAKLGRIFSRAESLVFFWTALVMGFGMGMIDGYLFLLLRDMGATDMLLGLTLTITCLAEAPIFQLLGLLLKTLGGADALIDISLGAYALRMMLYALLPKLESPWWVLPVELLHGLTFGCGWGAGCEKSKALAPPGLEATQQGIFQNLYFGVGTGLGSLVGGYVAQAHGFQNMFFVGGLIVALGWLLSILGRGLLKLNNTPAGGAYSPVAVDQEG